MPEQSVLFVDDEPNVLDGLKRMLRPLKDDWVMEFVTSGDEAIKAMKTKLFDVIVADMRMPGMNGAQLLKYVSEYYPDTVRFILSGYSNRELILQSVGFAHQYLAKPCDAKTLKDAVMNSLSLRKIRANDELRKIISGIQSLPTPPAIYNRLVMELQSESASIQSVAKIVSEDVAITAKLLQIVNSAFFGLPTHVESVFQAISLLGFETVRALVMAAGVFTGSAAPGIEGLSVSTVYAHSLPTGAISQRIARALGLDRRLSEDALMSGTLHDIGKLLMLNYFHGDVTRAMKMAREQGISHTIAEKKVFGVTHAEIGAYLLSLWGLPDSIVEAVAFHHTPRATANPRLGVLTCVHIGNLFEHEQSAHSTQIHDADLDIDYLESLGIADQVSHLRSSCVPETVDAKQ